MFVVEDRFFRSSCPDTTRIYGEWIPGSYYACIDRSGFFWNDGAIWHMLSEIGLFPGLGYRLQAVFGTTGIHYVDLYSVCTTNLGWPIWSSSPTLIMEKVTAYSIALRNVQNYVPNNIYIQKLHDADH